MAVETLSLRQVLADRWTGARCTLNGKPAVIRGRLLPFASVAYLNTPVSVEYTWETVNRVMLRGGNFVA